MIVAIPKERRAGETRVAASVDTVKKLILLGLEVVVEKGAGVEAAVTDEAYKAAGATIAKDAKATLEKADIVLKVQRPTGSDEKIDEIALMKQGAVLCCILNAYNDKPLVEALAAKQITTFGMEFVPRITRAQSMDVLSSQSNLAGYKAVLDGASEFGRAFPMMMTAAGTIPPARVMIMGVGVAGLQAIATARRLGAIVSATDVRAATKEQVESLGATFVMVDSEEAKQAETAGGYAKEMSEEYKKQQAALIAETLKKQDMAICTALIPGRKAPILITAEMVASMKPGSVIVDLAVEQGGNCELSEPGKVVNKNGVKIVGHLNVPGRIAVDASQLYAKNLLNFVTLLIDKDSKALKIDLEDEIVKGTLVTQDGAIVHPALKSA
ncbi:MAG: Re/Si-specific NAD(P)(+) transhydrogenase subunit alpha [Alphaproteobacteria bacterium]|nr:Re/Si-specific NAD(P)(+) transhydrogenase subunit alpha [Alphaproteobacteria bacterium]MBU0795593.1 Re/Si-specific NAD(P)(+) transhydrogenase subunit alpha [Alphaproteobacteria bacterium]MBU0887650.1 Re/Si-specific NAD(P)(+) transhydrogenase subunit alpha [Alphaproteobacteria bacterium]MBU1812923.1 Re/Si-specific NAD(P)(+) transhydrogenase subunit alpha [Alphaproteobacteria bacterium]